ncbi:ribokinase [Leptolyngbya sp. FACHB-261]|uniref:ribokinase n=1 Tax=Leptolyngbya sp. FACHB-261 TaxID=2692806 RepID=UPI0016843A03|nr:ribokinase [Leptolyngbya sp. FACHB-261]MBD2104805.1 ribokinase [Leptolyngbya sp. FACHB-261]
MSALSRAHPLSSVPRVVVVGSINMDLVVQAPQLPQRGATVLGSNYQYCPGGKGANQAVAAARLGAQVTLVGQVGQDEAGTQLLAGLKRDNIDISVLSISDQHRSGLALVTVDQQGENTIVVVSGANQGVDQAYVHRAAGTFAGADTVLLQLEIPLSGVVEAAQLAHQAGAQVILNPSPIQALPPELLALVQVLVLNQNESRTLTRRTAPDAATSALLELGPETIVVTAGAAGAWVATRTQPSPVHVPGFRVEAVDTTGAGDAFTGALAVALAEGEEIRSAVEFANAAGAAATAVLGAYASLPCRADLEQVRSNHLLYPQRS